MVTTLFNNNALASMAIDLSAFICLEMDDARGARSLVFTPAEFCKNYVVSIDCSFYAGGHSGQQRAGALGREPDLHDAIQRYRWRRCAAPSAAASRLFKRR